MAMPACRKHQEPCLDGRLQHYAASIPESKGTLALFLVVTDHARKRGLPLDADHLVVNGGGQVKRLGRPAVQKILARHGITEVLAREGGRTSMGSVARMRGYVDLLNRLHEEGLADPDAIEAFWIARVRDFLARRRTAPAPVPVQRRSRLRLTLDPTRSVGSTLRDLLRQAEDRDAAGPPRAYVGAVLHYLVAATLDWEPRVLPEHPDGPAKDAPHSRAGSFETGDTEIHVTAGPSEAVIAGCRETLDWGRQPVLITLPAGIPAATHLAETACIRDQLEVFDIEHFVAIRLHVRTGFIAAGIPAELRRLVARYNEIVERNETDPSLRIRFRRPARPPAGALPLGTMAAARPP